MAVGAIGVLALFGSQVADVDEVETLFDGDSAGGFESFEGGGRQVLHLVSREETGEVQRDVSAEVRFDPAGKLANLFGFIVECGDDEVSDFEDDTGGGRVDKRPLNGGESAGADFAIELLCHTFQVDVGGIDDFEQLLPRFGVDIGGGYEDVAEIVLVSELSGVVGVLVIYDRVGIGVGK